MKTKLLPVLILAGVAMLVGCASDTDDDETPLAPTTVVTVKPGLQTDDLYLQYPRGSNNRSQEVQPREHAPAPPPPPPP